MKRATHIASFTGKDPRKGTRTPLNQIKCSEQRDEETGYGYFGARYMDHELMTMWLSVDPMADKYPGISPYAYCAWNPVKLVDPDGRDVWEVNQYGELIWKQDSETDVVKAADGSSVELSTGVLQRGHSYRKEDGYLRLYLDKNDGGHEGQKLFEFLADHSTIEFSLLGVDLLQEDESRYTCSILTTSFSSEGDDYGSELSHQFIESLITHTHNHPKGYIAPSSPLTNPDYQGLNDRDFSNAIKQNNPGCRFFIYGEYQKGGEYREYNGENEGVRTRSKFNKEKIYTIQ